jgi:hypothetical protein
LRQGYAANTTVSPEKSKAEIEGLLRRYGADQFVAGWDTRRALIGFRAAGRHIRFELALPDPNDAAFRPKRRSYRGRAIVSAERYEGEVRRRWRALALVIKAKLEAVQTGITSFESEFMAHIVMPDGRTISEHVTPAIAAAYDTGKVRALLPEFTS